MSELINQTGAILEKGAELMKNPAIGGAVTGLFGWLKEILNKKAFKEKLELVETNKHNQDTIAGLKANLEFILEDNDEMRDLLAEKVKEIEILSKKSGIENVTKSNVMNNTGNGITGFQDITGNIAINK